MSKHGWFVACVLAASLVLPGKPFAQEPSPDALAMARELVIAAKMSEQIKLMLPTIMEQLKPLIVRGYPQAERDYDLLTPTMLTATNAHLDAYTDKVAGVYARHFTAEELRNIVNFYRTSTGQKFVQKQPEILQEIFGVAQTFGQAIAADAQRLMTEELRKRGHKL